MGGGRKFTEFSPGAIDRRYATARGSFRQIFSTRVAPLQYNNVTTRVRKTPRTRTFHYGHALSRRPSRPRYMGRRTGRHEGNANKLLTPY